MLFLDSNVFLWVMQRHSRLDPEVQERIRLEPELVVSAVTPWELWIKFAAGRLPPAPGDIEAELAAKRIGVVPVSLDDSRLAAHLPPLHKDPFDRMIVAQALNRQATLVTGDKLLAAYGVSTLLV